MTQVFDTYNKHSTAYKLTEIFSALFGISILILIFIQNSRFNDVLSDFWQTFFLITFLISFVGFIIGILIRIIPSNILMYIKNGELELNSNSIHVDSELYHLENLDKVEFKVIGYRGQGGSRGGKDGTGNRIKIYKKSKQFVEKSFVINTKNQRDNLKDILMQWKQTGFKVKVDGFDLR